MTKGDLLTILLANLDFVSVDTNRENYLNNLIDTAISLITREGATLKEPYTIEDGNLVVMYAAYLFRKRATNEPMPRMLRFALNNRIFGGKADGAE